MRRRGFTVVELLLALSLASVVLASMVSVVRLLMVADAVSEKRVEQQTDLTVSQNLIRRVMVSLAAAQPLDPVAARELLLQQTQAAQAETDNAEEPADAPNGSAALGMGMEPVAPPDIAPMFDLYFEEIADGDAAPVLECVVIDPPGALDPNATRFSLADFRTIAQGNTREGSLLSRRIVQSVRGRFELQPFYDLDEEIERWALVWRGVDPPSEPYVLLRGVTGLVWKVLPISSDEREYRDTLSAKLATEFPMAVRLVVWLDDGRYLDWMFETEIQVLRPDTGDEFQIPNDETPDSSDEDSDDDIREEEDAQ